MSVKEGGGIGREGGRKGSTPEDAATARALAYSPMTCSHMCQ